MRKRILSMTLALALMLSVILTVGSVAVAEKATTPFDPAGPAGGYMNLAYIYQTNMSSITPLDFTPLTHINYAFGLIHNDEWLDPLAPATSRESWNLWQSNEALRDTVYLSGSNDTVLKGIVAKKNAEAPWVKVTLSVGGDGARGFSNMATTSERRANFIASCMQVVDTYGLDGIDLDWEFPSMDGWGSLKCSPDDRENFTLLLKELRAALDLKDPSLILSIASSGNTLFPEDWTNMAEASKYLDYVNIMTYDFRYGSMYFDWPLGSSRDWPTLNLEDDWNALLAVESYVGAGVPREKIGIGNKPGSLSFPYTSGIGELMADVITKYSGVNTSGSGANATWPSLSIHDIESLINEGKIDGPYVTAAPTVFWWRWINSAISASGWSGAAYGTNIPERVMNRLDGKIYTGSVAYTGADSSYGTVAKEFEFHRDLDRLAGLAVVYAYNLTDDPGRNYKLFCFSYNDADSMALRAEYIKGQGLKGIFYWQYSNNTQTIWDVQQWSVALKNTPSAPAPNPADYINLGYIYSSSLSAIDNLDLAAVTHVNYAFGLIYNNEYNDPTAPRYGNREGWGNATELEADPSLLHTVRVGEWNASGSPLNRPRPGETALHKIVEQRDAYAPATKVLLSVGGDGCRGFSDMASAPESRQIFVNSCLGIIDEYGLDGIDLDWEFPSMDGWGALKCSPDDRANFTLLLKDLREAFDEKDPALLLTIAGSANTLFPQDWANMAEASKYLNYINIMTYDFRYGSSYFDWALASSRKWGSLMTTDDWTADFAVHNYVTAGVPPEKLTIGYKPGNTTMPGDIRTLVNGALGPNGHDGDNFASSWENAKASTTNWNWVNSALSASSWNSGARASNPMYVNVMEMLDGKTYNGTSGGATKQIEFNYEWDRQAGLGLVIAYNLTDDPGRTQKLFVMSFNDPASIERRASYAIETGLLGTFFWSYGDSANTRYVTKAYSAALGKYTYVNGLTVDENAEVEEGEEITVNAVISPADASNKRIRWTTSNAAIATVSADGVVTGVSEGSCTITARADDGEGQFVGACELTVTPADPCKFGHSYVAVVTAPTCTEKGFTTYTCSVCGDSYIGDEVPATGHSYVAVVTAPTCTEKGFTTYTCSVCGDSYVGDEVPALGHTPGGYIVVLKPTRTEKGAWEEYCSVCGELIGSGEIDKLSIVGAKTDAKGFVSMLETSKNSRVWELTFIATVALADENDEIVGEEDVLYTISLNGNNANLDGSYAFGAGNELAGFTLIYDIKGNGSNIKEFKIV